MQQAAKLKQPTVFYLMFISAMWERFGYYVVGGLIVLYIKSVFLMSDTQAFVLFGVFTAFCYLVPPIGGYLADNIMGIKRCLMLGMVLEAAGFTLLAFHGELIFYAALGLIIVGSGLFRACPTDIIARSYEEDDPRIDSGFTLFYMAINIGSFISFLIAGTIQRFYGWHVAFFTAAIGLYLGIVSVIIFNYLINPYEAEPGKKPLPMKKWLLVIFGAVVLSCVLAILTAHSEVTNIAFIFIGLIFILYLLYEISRSPAEEKRGIVACVILMLMGLVFYLFYYQAYTSINLFVERNVNHQVLGIYIPTATFLIFNPFWIFILSPILAIIYKRLGKHGKDLAITTKFPLGILITSGCFLLLALSAHFYNAQAQVSPLWVVLAYLFYSLGELLISALGVAMVTHIAPKRMYGVMMGAWFFIAAGLGASLSGVLANVAKIPTDIHDPFVSLHIYKTAFLNFGLAGLSVTLLAFIVGFYVNRLIKL